MRSFPSTLLSAIMLVVMAAPAVLSASSSNGSTSSVASQFKAPNAETPAPIAAAWNQQDKELWSYIEQHVPAVLEHTGASSFDEHLKGVQAVLRYWKAPDYLASAGLLHSIFGTEGFQGFSLPLSERGAIQKMIGEKAEKLCFVFCMVDRFTLDQTLWQWTPGGKPSASYTLRARPELGRFPLVLNHEEWLDFIELTLADWLEQVEGAAKKTSDLYGWKQGEAYSYRRTAYRQMSKILAVERAPRLQTVATAMLDAVMATESSETKGLVQPRTPPISQPARDAWAALRASGEDVPDSFLPSEEDMAPSCDATES